MKHLKTFDSVFHIQMTKRDLLYISDQVIYSKKNSNQLSTTNDRFLVVSDHVQIRKAGILRLYNHNLELTYELTDKRFEKYNTYVYKITNDYLIYGVGLPDTNNVRRANYYKYSNSQSTLIHTTERSVRQELIFLSAQRAIEILSFYGTAPYKLNHFRYLDIETKETLWEYRCEEGNHIIHRPIVRGGYVYFYEYIEQGIQLPDDSQTLVRLDLQTGEELARVDAMATTTYMEDRGLLVALRPTPRDRVYNRPLLQYCIVELDSMEVKTGKVPQDDIKHNSVDFPHQRAWEGERVYFVSSPVTFNPQNKHHPSFGCFNVETLKIEFIQHLLKATGAAIS